MLNYNTSLVDFIVSTLAAGMPASAILMTLQGRKLLNVDYRRVGGLRFFKLGRLTISLSISKTYRPIGGK